MSVLRARDDEQARRVAVEPVDDAGPLLVVAAGRVEREQPVHERAAAMAAGGMDDDPRGLVDDEEVLVLPGDRQLHLLGCERLRRGGKLDHDLLAALEPVALRPRAAVDEDGAVRDEPLGERARADLAARGESAVEPARLRDAEAESAQATAGACGGPPRRAPRRGSRPRRR